jgi:hypothetical protein
MFGAPKGGNSSLWKLKLQLAGGKLMNYGPSHLKRVLCMSDIKDRFIPQFLLCFGYLTRVPNRR